MAQAYIITSFKNRVTNVVWRLNERHGSYIDVPDTVFAADDRVNHMKHLNDFLCDGNFIINSIKDSSKRIPEEFTIGDLTNQFLQNPIVLFKIINKDVILVTTPVIGRLAENTVRMINATKYKKPEVKPQQAKVATTASSEDKKDRFHQLRKSIETTYAGKEIRLEKTLRKRKETLQEFLTIFFEEWNLDKDTIYVATQDVQTIAGKRRSLGDIYMICKYYYPKVTLEEIIRILYTVLPTALRGFCSCKCSQIQKRVWFYEEGRTNNDSQKDAADEYSHTMHYYRDKLNES